MVLGRAVSEPTNGWGAGDPDADARLVREMIAGSEDALAALYDRHANAVYSAAMRASGDASIAADALQETFLTLWDRAELFDPSRGSLPGWLRTIARNRAVDHLRAAARRGRAATFSSFGVAGADQDQIDEWLMASGRLIGIADTEAGPEVALSSNETRASIEEALASLGPLERSVITLAYRTGLSQSEIAASLGWPIGTVKTRTRRALRHLRDWLEGTEPGEGSRGAGAPRVTTGPVRALQAGAAAVGRGDGRCWSSAVGPSRPATLSSTCH